jgi:2,4-dienoyl-CoA reductase-like NADH-dependent reductase (Old Yellow Enzyme family)
VGVILTGFTSVDDWDKTLVPIFNLSNDDYIDDHKKLTDLVHTIGSKIFTQIVFIGSHDFKEMHRPADIVHKTYDYVAPSSFLREDVGITPREASIADLNNVKEKHAKAALRAKKAGYDGVEVHAAHGFFLSQFMSPHFNKRTDAYGGSLEKRCSLAVEIYKEIRDAVGSDFPIVFKINVRERYSDGVTLEDAVTLSKKLSKEKIDAIEISGFWGDFDESGGAFFEKEGTIIADNVDAKVILTGGVRVEKEMKRILNNTKIEYFGLARPLIKDANFIKQLSK